MNYDRALFVDEVMQECWDRKAELAAAYPTWEAYLDHLQRDRPRLEAEGWQFASPGSVVPEMV